MATPRNTSTCPCTSRTGNTAVASQELALSIKTCHSASEGNLVHTFVAQSHFYEDRFFANLLIDMYGQCGALDDALAVFGSITYRNVFSWNLVIRTCVLNGHALHALSLFDQMAGENVTADRVTLLAAVSACTHLKDLDQAKRLESCIANCDVTVDEVIQSAEINMFYKCGSLEDAERIFESMQKRDVVCWNTMMAAYSQLGQSEKALALFDKMVLKGINPSQATYCTLFTTCANEGFLSEGRHLYTSLKSSCMKLDLILGNALISMYGKCNSVAEANFIFDILHDRDHITWNAMMSAWVDSGFGEEALQLFHQMQMECVIADKMIITNGLCACACVLNLLAGKQFHACLPPSVLISDIIVSTALVNMYGKCQCVMYAQIVFDELADRDMVAHNAMITAYISCGLREKSIQHFKQMCSENTFPGSVTYASVLDASCNKREGVFMHTQIVHAGFEVGNETFTTLITMYGRHGSQRQLELILDEVGERDVIVWNAMISASIQLQQYDNAFYCLQRLQVEGFIPTAATFASCLSACVTHAALRNGKHMHTVILGASLSLDNIVATSLVNMYGKCGSLEFAQIVFDDLSHQSSVTWNALLAAYAQHGCSQKAIDLFSVMLSRGICIDHATFSSVLSACSRTGFVDGGIDCFVSFLVICDMQPSVQHFNCLIDLFSRAGRLEEGKGIMYQMPIAPITTSWTALLAACRTHFDKEGINGLADLKSTSKTERDSILLLLENKVSASRHMSCDK